MTPISYRYCHFPPVMIQHTVAAAFRDLGLTARHHQARWKNNRIEGSHVYVRRRERKMQGFRSPGSAQRFLSLHAATYNALNTRRHFIPAAEHRDRRNQAFTIWLETAGIAGKAPRT